ncbi:MAG: glycosyltransferase family 2 protein [Desulfobacterales bacterium]|nr:glycosyltransferase family 2 protein [Deltaproteobacteria bacterium]MBL6970663.1 glycosyltransferase family 2 protein [Desulfobacterales bacterium]
MKSKRKERRLVIVPAFNEGKRIARVLKKIQEVDKEIDIIVIDDGSTDDTGLKSRLVGARVVRLSSNMGYGVAIQTGYKYALERGYDYVVQLDSDGQHDPDYLPKMFAEIVSGNVDLVIGSRFLKGMSSVKVSEMGYRVSPARKLGISLFAFLVSKFIGLKITDPTSGYRALNKQVIKFLANDFFPYDYPDADVVILAHRAGFKIKEIPMIMYDRTTGTSMHSGLKPVYYIFKMFLSMLMTLLRKKPSLS